MHVCLSMFDLLLSLLIKELTRYELLCEKPLYILLILGDNSRIYLNKPIALAAGLIKYV